MIEKSPRQIKDTMKSIPVEVAAKIARDIVQKALSGEDFLNKNGYTQWGQVSKAFEEEMMKVSDTDIIWNGQSEPEYEKKIRLIDSRFRNYPEPAKSEICDILANNSLRVKNEK